MEIVTPSVPEKFGRRLQLLHMRRRYLDDDDDRNAEQQSLEAHCQPQNTSGLSVG